MRNRTIAFSSLVAILTSLPLAAGAGRMEMVRVSPDGKGFVVAGAAGADEAFVPWGFNYSTSARLLEDFWDDHWDTVAGDFATMKGLGATVVRAHLQFPKFMDGPDKVNEHSLRQLGRLLELAERTGVYLDLTGLACFRKEDVPAWYDAMDEPARWAVQSKFWEAVAEKCSASPAVFCYDLINEPLVPGEKREAGQWLAGKLGPFYFLQFVTLDPRGRPREEVARQWARTLREAIRRKDRRHLITIGLLPATANGVHFSGFVPEKVAPELDFVSVHIYPEKGKIPDALAGLKRFAVQDKPLVVEETFPLACSAAELRQFIRESRATACGWVGHYEGRPIGELEGLERSGKLEIGQALMLEWLRLFRDLGPEMMKNDEKR